MIARSTFSGVGGMDLGLHRAGFDHAFFAELDPWRRDVLAAHWPGIPIYEDVRDVAAGGAVVGPADLLCGGFPCQDLSVAGRRAGLAGSRSGLFHEFARIADTVRPRWILLENVPGLLSSNDGRDMGVVAGTLADLGYGIAWRVLDARYFGVPQRRRRVFIVGCAGGDDTRAISALCEGCSGHPPTSDCSWQVAAGRSAGSDRGTGRISAAVTRKWAKGSGGPSGDEAQNLVVAGSAGGLDIAAPLLRVTGGPRTTDIDGATWVAGADASVRRLTPVECERLMGWPDNWTAPPGVKAPDTRRYAACGDGVVANVAEWIGRRIAWEDAR